MSDLFDSLQGRYQRLLALREKDETAGEFVDEVRAFIHDARKAGAAVSGLNERSQLRAWMRFLADFLYDATGVYPDTALQPLSDGQLVGHQPEPSTEPPSTRTVTWTLLGAAAVVIIAVGLAVVGWISRLTYSSSDEVIPTSAPMPSPTPALFVIDGAVGTALDTGGALKAPTEVFCSGTSEIMAELTVQGIEPKTEWRWEVQRDGQMVASQPLTPWGQDAQRIAVRILTGGEAGVEPGQYDLLVHVGEHVVGVRQFRVLEARPRVLNLQIADVPEPTGQSEIGSEFEIGVRVFYLSYDYEGLCPGLVLSHRLYRDGEAVQESVEAWDGDTQGRARVSFQQPADGTFLPGDYEATVVVADEEVVSALFSIWEPMPEVVAPALGDLTLALGVEPDGRSILTVPEDRFDWNTKVIYAIFEYVGMMEGMRWTAVWTRNGVEVAREERIWDVEADGTKGTHWAAYYNEDGRPILGGNYGVTLYLDDIAQRTAEFRILYYVPRVQ